MDALHWLVEDELSESITERQKKMTSTEMITFLISRGHITVNEARKAMGLPIAVGVRFAPIPDAVGVRFAPIPDEVIIFLKK